MKEDELFSSDDQNSSFYNSVLMESVPDLSSRYSTANR